MPTFRSGEAIVSNEPFIQIDNLEPGKHVFSLVVIDQAGNESAPDLATVTVISSR
jgi:hypothetical protein